MISDCCRVQQLRLLHLKGVEDNCRESGTGCSWATTAPFFGLLMTLAMSEHWCGGRPQIITCHTTEPPSTTKQPGVPTWVLPELHEDAVDAVAQAKLVEVVLQGRHTQCLHRVAAAR